MWIDKKYQGHANVLTKDGLAPNIFPSIKEIRKKSDASNVNNGAKRENRSGGRGPSTYFYASLSKILWENIFNTIENFVTPMPLPGYVLKCTITNYQT